VTDLTPLCALGTALPQARRIGALTIGENAGLGLASLARRRDGGIPDLGLALPGPGAWAESGRLAAFWTGPDQWMIEGPGRAEQDFAAWVAARAPGCSVTEQTDGFAAFEIDGPAPLLVALLEGSVNLDAGRFGPGSATRTGLHHMSVFVIRRSETRLAVLGMRSAAGAIWHRLAETAGWLEGLS